MIASTLHYAYEIVHFVWLTKIPPLTPNQSTILNSFLKVTFLAKSTITNFIVL